MAAGLRGSRAGADRQRRARPAAARRLWRGDGRAASGPPRRARRPTRPAGRCSARCSSISRRSGASRTRASGRCAGRRRHFTYSKVMAWVAFDRAVQGAEEFGLDGPVERWRAAARRDPCARSAGTASTPSSARFVQSYGSQELDASLLLLPLVGLPAAGRPAHAGTVAAIERRLLVDGLRAALRHRHDGSTACRPARAPSSPAASGWPTPMSCTAGTTRRGGCSSGCWRCATMSACWRRSTIRGAPAGRQLPAGVLARGAGQHGPEPDPAAKPAEQRAERASAVVSAGCTATGPDRIANVQHPASRIRRHTSLQCGATCTARAAWRPGASGHATRLVCEGFCSHGRHRLDRGIEAREAGVGAEAGGHQCRGRGGQPRAGARGPSRDAGRR